VPVVGMNLGEKISTNLLKDFFEELKAFGTFGIAFFNANGEKVYGNLMDTYNQLAKMLTKKLFGTMRISDFLQRGLPDLDAKMYIFKITEEIAVAIITRETLGRILVSINKILQKL